MAGLQTQPDKNRLYNGPFDAMKKISSTYGISGLFKGQVATFTREAVGYGAYFWAYETLVQKWMRETHRKRDELPAPYELAYVAAAGYAVSIIFKPHR
jgi:solute carrier family 25 carnitine/acylcarnitine transporter 20/29